LLQPSQPSYRADHELSRLCELSSSICSDPGDPSWASGGASLVRLTEKKKALTKQLNLQVTRQAGGNTGNRMQRERRNLCSINSKEN